MTKGGVLYASEARDIAIVGPGDEIESARGIVDRAVKVEAKKDKKVFTDAITAKRREIFKRACRSQGAMERAL